MSESVRWGSVEPFCVPERDAHHQFFVAEYEELVVARLWHDSQLSTAGGNAEHYECLCDLRTLKRAADRDRTGIISLEGTSRGPCDLLESENDQVEAIRSYALLFAVVPWFYSLWHESGRNVLVARSRRASLTHQ